MPGEDLEDALVAARELQTLGEGVILTYLGENLASTEDTDRVAERYLEAVDRIEAAGLGGHISVKPTQLGIDIAPRLAESHLLRLVDRAGAAGVVVWIDMERSAYVDRTLDLFRAARARSPQVGVALQAYLRRTPGDLTALLALGPKVRVVKGAYLEPASLAYPGKADVDRQFFDLATRLIGEEGQGAGAHVHVATHDAALIDRIEAWALAHGAPATGYEYAMLYGIQRRLQARLAAAGRPPRVLISYGENWFPWYMRRLAERPANVWFAVKGGSM
jgi:proline dehydrogenase